jgi:hypothetical protein
VVLADGEEVAPPPILSLPTRRPLRKRAKALFYPPPKKEIDRSITSVGWVRVGKITTVQKGEGP